MRNRLLSSLDPDDFARLQPHLRHVDLAVRAPLVTPFVPITHVWFPESGIISVIVSMPDGRQVEAGIIGREGMIDIAILNGADVTPLSSVVQAAGTAFRIAVSDLRAAIESSLPLRARLARFAQAFTIQVAHTAFANAANTIEERLARWLLMATDRVGEQDAIAMTHEFLATMLGVRRAGVTVAVQALVDIGAVRPSRGQIAVHDRAKLIAASKGTYGPPELEYKRLLGSNGELSPMAGDGSAGLVD